MAYVATIHPSSTSTALALSLLSSSSPSDPTSTAHLTAHIRAALRSEQSALNDAKRKAKRARTRMEELAVEREALRAERQALGAQAVLEQHEVNPMHEQTNLLPQETFHELASQALKAGLPSPTDSSYTQQLTLARLHFEVSQVQERELQLAELQRKLVEVKGKVAIAKKGSLEVDAGLVGMMEAASRLQGQLETLAPPEGEMKADA